MVFCYKKKVYLWYFEALRCRPTPQATSKETPLVLAPSKVLVKITLASNLFVVTVVPKTVPIFTVSMLRTGYLVIILGADKP